MELFPDADGLTVGQEKPGTKPQYLFDGGGLYLQIMPSGGKWWQVKYRIGGKVKLLSVSVYPDVSIREARERRAAARKLAQGQNAGKHRKADKREAQARRDNFFAAMAEAWVCKKYGTWAPSTAAKTRFYLDRDLLPALVERAIAEIRRTDLVETVFSSRDDPRQPMSENIMNLAIQRIG